MSPRRKWWQRLVPRLPDNSGLHLNRQDTCKISRNKRNALCSSAEIRMPVSVYSTHQHGHISAYITVSHIYSIAGIHPDPSD
jgi:hypothetical protein